MGLVYKARDRETGDIVALKVLKREIASEPEWLERLKTELMLARKVTHKNVCRVHDLHRIGGAAAIAMEFVEGQSLRALLNRVEGLSTRHGLRIARQFIAGLAEAHAQGVIHRDLKPENILIGKDGTVKVMDFGIARSVEASKASTGSIIGTPAYMSPEQAQGKSGDARSDIYSLGLVLYEVFTGQPACEADTPVGLAYKQVHETPASPSRVDPDIPMRIERAIEKCLRKDPAERFQSARELEAVLIGEPEVPTTAPRPTKGEVPWPLHMTCWQRSDWLLLGGALLCIVVFFVLFFRFHPAPALQITANYDEQKRIVFDVLTKLGVKAEPRPEPASIGCPDYYRFAEVTDPIVARELVRRFGCDDFVYSGELARPGERLLGGWYRTNAKGAVVDVELTLKGGPAPVEAPPDAAALAKMREVAEKAIVAAFGVDVSALGEPEVRFYGTPRYLYKFLRWRAHKGSAAFDETFYAYFRRSDLFSVDRRPEL